MGYPMLNGVACGVGHGVMLGDLALGLERSLRQLGPVGLGLSRPDTRRD